MDMNHNFSIHRAEPRFRRRNRPERKLQPESVAIMGILASFWIFVILRLIADAYA